MGELVGLLGLGLALPGTLDVLYRAGVEMQKRFVVVKGYDKELQTYKALGLNLSQGMLRSQVDFVCQSSRAGTIPKELFEQLDSCFHSLLDSINTADRELQRCASRSLKQKAKMIFLGEQVTLEACFRTLEQHQVLFERLCNCVHRVRTTPPEALLTSNVFSLVHESATAETPGSYLKRSSIFVSTAQYKKDQKIETLDVIVETQEYRRHTVQEVETAVQNLTSQLRSHSFSTGTLRCLGYRKSPFTDSFEVVFESPRGCILRSLSDHLLTDPMPALENRLEMCKQLAAIVSDVHRMDRVHKNVRSQTVLLAAREAGDLTRTELYLTDWTMVREINQASRWIGEDDWQRAVYHHPTRQQSKAQARYGFRHDLYSLGVCMLEIMMWMSLIIETDDNTVGQYAINDIFQHRAISMGKVPEHLKGNTISMTRDPQVVFDVLIDLVQSELPRMVGTKITDAVKRCFLAVNQPVVLTQEAEDIGYVREVILVLNSVSI